MKTFLSFVGKETRHIVRDRRTMLILFGMPVMMMLLLGFAVRTDVKEVRTVVVTASADHLTRRLVAELAATEHFTLVGTASTAASAERFIRCQRADMAVVFSPSFAARLAKGEGCVQLITDGADPNMARQYTNYARSIFMQALAGGRAAGAGAGLPVSVKMLYNPEMQSAYNFVPGIMGMLLMIVCALMTSVSIVREKERGTMELLLVSPVRPLTVIVAKAVPYMVLSLVVLTAILLMSHYVLAVPLSGSLFWIFAVSALYILLALVLGLLISNVAKTQIEALLVSAMVLLMPCLLLSGMIFPVESMPPVLQWVAHAVPTTYYIRAMRKLMIMGVGVENVLTEVAVLAGMVLGLAALNIYRPPTAKHRPSIAKHRPSTTTHRPPTPPKGGIHPCEKVDGKAPL